MLSGSLVVLDVNLEFLSNQKLIVLRLFIPMISLSSGDGINSFGNDSRDPDKGSLNWVVD